MILTDKSLKMKNNIFLSALILCIGCTEKKDLKIKMYGVVIQKMSFEVFRKENYEGRKPNHAFFLFKVKSNFDTRLNVDSLIYFYEQNQKVFLKYTPPIDAFKLKANQVSGGLVFSDKYTYYIDNPDSIDYRADQIKKMKFYYSFNNHEFEIPKTYQLNYYQIVTLDKVIDLIRKEEKEGW